MSLPSDNNAYSHNLASPLHPSTSLSSQRIEEAALAPAYSSMAVVEMRVNLSRESLKKEYQHILQIAQINFQLLELETRMIENYQKHATFVSCVGELPSPTSLSPLLFCPFPL
jgi:hypothetical protein